MIRQPVTITLQASGMPDEKIGLDARVWKAARKHATQLGMTIEDYIAETIRNGVSTPRTMDAVTIHVTADQLQGMIDDQVRLIRGYLFNSDDYATPADVLHAWRKCSRRSINRAEYSEEDREMLDFTADLLDTLLAQAPEVRHA